MIEDLLTMIWKEGKGLLRYNDNRWKGLVTLLTPIALFGIVLPLQFRDQWLTSYWSVIVSLVTPLMLVATTIAESFAGERERHTLETLLSSRLPDRVILFGKFLMSVLFGWCMTIFLLFFSLIIVNIIEWGGAIRFYQSVIFWIDIGGSLLMSGMVAGLGILVSMRSTTVQSAVQTLMILLFMPFLILQAVVFLLPTFLPETTTRLILDQLNITTILIVVLGILAAANVGLCIGSILRFQRNKMIL